MTVQDTRFAWQTLEGRIVRLHWYDGDQSFAQHAVDIGDQAIEQAEQLLGVQETEKVDFFIYDNEDAFRAALGPGTRENVGGTAVSSIRTLFGLIEPSDINSDWVRILVTHELTHLVFNTAVQNPYHLPPRWLNEGLAVYLSEGNDQSERDQVSSAIDGGGGLIPLQGLGGLFPTGDGFALGLRRVGLGRFLSRRCLRQGRPRQADSQLRRRRDRRSGVHRRDRQDLVAFDDSWLASLGTTRATTDRTEPAPPGPVPPDWQSAPAGRPHCSATLTRRWTPTPHLPGASGRRSSEPRDPAARQSVRCWMFGSTTRFSPEAASLRRRRVDGRPVGRRHRNPL